MVTVQKGSLQMWCMAPGGPILKNQWPETMPELVFQALKQSLLETLKLTTVQVRPPQEVYHHQIEASVACFRPNPTLEVPDPSGAAKVMHDAPGTEAPPCCHTRQGLSKSHL